MTSQLVKIHYATNIPDYCIHIGIAVGILLILFGLILIILASKKTIKG